MIAEYGWDTGETTPELNFTQGDFTYNQTLAVTPKLSAKARIRKVEVEIKVMCETMNTVILSSTSGGRATANTWEELGDNTYKAEMLLTEPEKLFTENNWTGVADLSINVYSGSMTALYYYVFRVYYIEDNTLDYHDGNEWKTCIPYCFTGTEWIQCIPYYFDGEKWVELSTT